MITLSCAICGSKQNLQVLYKERLNKKKITASVFSARRTPDRQHFRFVKCKRCGLIFSNPIFEKEKLENFYKKSDFDYRVESEYLRKTYIDYFKKYIFLKNASKKKLLEIGCGNGFFLEETEQLGFDSYGVEPGEKIVYKSAPKIRKKIKVDILKPGIFKKNTFDTICCFHTLDHIVDISAFLNETYSLLKNKGYIFFIVHNTDGLSVKLLGERSPIFDIEHVYLFNKKTLVKLFKKSNFKVKSVFDISNTYPIQYWLRLFPLPAFLKKRALSFISLSLLGRIPIKFNAGNIGIIAKKI